MGRILLIFSLILYVLYKFGFFKGLSEGLQNPSQRRPPNSNVNVDGPTPKEKKRTDFKGGEYVDYEEIK